MKDIESEEHYFDEVCFFFFERYTKLNQPDLQLGEVFPSSERRRTFHISIGQYLIISGAGTPFVQLWTHRVTSLPPPGAGVQHAYLWIRFFYRKAKSERGALHMPMLWFTHCESSCHVSKIVTLWVMTFISHHIKMLFQLSIVVATVTYASDDLSWCHQEKRCLRLQLPATNMIIRYAGQVTNEEELQLRNTINLMLSWLNADSDLLATSSRCRNIIYFKLLSRVLVPWSNDPEAVLGTHDSKRSLKLLKWWVFTLFSRIWSMRWHHCIVSFRRQCLVLVYIHKHTHSHR